jgi:16S rRNA A1518/A1519 N6-dimethyltransferase RsmA/KsgA/DIM1 with predicted DNA glycosylase/AP lyase activity
MRALRKRLCRLENRLIPRPEVESALVALLRTRQERHAEAEGRPYIEEPYEDLSGLTLVQILQRRRLARQ